ncbi:hypothetical protein PBY51_015704 [Eleginops maclovinus]|uniref:Uncharacterized protein n=1 Tax=Eleginops maclovinus TaxID=56733 RepID=A0AAN8AQ48_ELEMC|nr:hypothetical protein PBY51_015704 [Eleginops maclovinus]
MLADKLGVPGHDWSQTADSLLGVSVFLCQKPAANTRPTERKLLTKPQLKLSLWSYFLGAENVPLSKPAFMKAIPCLFSILLATERNYAPANPKKYANPNC